MIFSIPIFIEERSSGPERPPTYIVRPLFHPGPVQRGEKLSRALTKLSNDLHRALHDLGHEPRHDELAQWTFNPLLDETTLELRLELASGSHRRPFFLVGYAGLGRKLYFTPTVPELHFEVLRTQTLADRAETVLQHHFRQLERDGAEVDLDNYALAGKARLTTIEIALNPAALAKKPEKPSGAFLFGGAGKKDGEVELRKTGRSLNAMYPDDLDRAVGREREVEELARLLAAVDRRPVLLVGPRKVGKTTILHELAWQMCARKKERYGGRREIWLVSPMRLISGMSVLGEWENRVLAILEHANTKDCVLYFDDLLGLFNAGMSAGSDLNVAQVLRPWIEKRSVRVMAEITPEAWRVLRERDRALADLFHVIPVNEPPEAETVRVLINVGRQMEEAHRCKFDLEIVPTAYELHRRFVPDAAFPGKAAVFLKRLAVRFPSSRITRLQALQEFHVQSGLQIAMLDDRTRLERDGIVGQLQRRVVGQDHALHAFADILVTLKARLNDPRRPLATLLLLGPTGVGKTEAAKSLAEYLFGGSERLLRFDMNEYVDGASASRLTGSPQEPEGLLTSAVRRQPFSVVLFDEIEKAAPEVIDLLLAVLDEGRLTDSLGRVTDFTQTVILLTSNLGSRDVRSRLGFGAAEGMESEDAIYVSAAEKFFRPEFFNRLDRIIPFRSLDRAHLEGIARRLIASLLTRDGLRRRDALVNVTPEAMTRLVELGHHPQLGARALKRVIEREVAQPTAELLAGLPPGTPMIATLAATTAGFVLQARDLSPVARSVLWPETLAHPRPAAAQSAWVAKLLDGVYAALNRIEAELRQSAPAGKIELGSLQPEQARYFLCQEQLDKVSRLAEAATEAQALPRQTVNEARRLRAKSAKLPRQDDRKDKVRLERFRDAVALDLGLADLYSESAEVSDVPLMELLRELALLAALVARPVDTDAALLVFRACLPVDHPSAYYLAQAYAECLGEILGAPTEALFESRTSEALLSRANVNHAHAPTLTIFLKGINVRRLLPAVKNTILTRRADGATGIILMTLEPVASAAEARVRAKQLTDVAGQPEPESFGPVIQRVLENRSLTDFRTGMVVSLPASPEQFRALLLSALPLPSEVESQLAT